jgi:glycosyltransferase involved in cell wall biosynthesis
MGKGVALSTGFKRAVSMGMGHVVTLDADGQHNPAEIPKFARRVAETGADIVVGNRFGALAAMPWLRRSTNWLTSKVVSALARQRIPDSQNGYRMIGAQVLTSITLETARYEAESEILIKAGRRGFRIDSVPVETIYGEEVSAIHPVIDTARFFRLVYKALFW